MPKGVTKEDIWQATKMLAQEEKIPTIMDIRSKLGGGSPHKIASYLADWKTEHLENEMLFHTDWEVQSSARKALEQEQIELMEEIDRLDSDLEKAREETTDAAETLDTERKAHESMKSHGNRWYRQMKEATDTAEKLTAQNQALQMRIAVLEEQAARGEELKAQVEKLQNALAGLTAEKETKTDDKPKTVTQPKASVRPKTRKATPEKKSAALEKTFPPSFGVAQKIRKLGRKR
uniref:Replication region DNA-binding N-term n=1 Tax=Candidatus Kentrum sp. FW TaxID=2126338 RepID=A0A450S1M7_9GAMM|nr:MAG: replication region DNA-binding N-term [Candidatus Kentron sp. FW]